MACNQIPLSINDLLNSTLVKLPTGGFALNVVNSGLACPLDAGVDCNQIPFTIENLLNAILSVDSCGKPALQLNIEVAGGGGAIPPNYARFESINPAIGTTSFTLPNAPLQNVNSLPPIVTIGGLQIPSTDWNITGTTFNYPSGIAASGGGAGGQDLIITYQY